MQNSLYRHLGVRVTWDESLVDVRVRIANGKRVMASFNTIGRTTNISLSRGF